MNDEKKIKNVFKNKLAQPFSRVRFKNLKHPYFVIAIQINKQ